MTATATRDRAPARNRRRLTGVAVAPYLFVLPNMLLFAVFTIYPAVNGFNVSLYDSSNGRTFTWVGTGNYENILGSQEFWTVARQTAVFVVASVVATTAASTLLALLLDAQRRGRAALRAAYVVPFLVSPVVVGLIWGLALERQGGLVNTVLAGLGLGRPGWLLDGTLATVVVVAVGVWSGVGFFALIQLAGLQGIDRSVHEAATVDGAGTLARTRFVVLPLLRPTTLVVVVLSTIQSFQAFDYIYTLTGGGPLGATTLMIQFIYEASFESPIRYGLASAAGVVLFLVVFGTTLGNYLVGRRQEAS